MRRLGLLGGLLALALMLAGTFTLAVVTSGPAKSFSSSGDLSALPGCAGRCHINGGFEVDPVTGRKRRLGGGGGGGGVICSTRNKCGPLFCQMQKTCCDRNQRCTTVNVGRPTPR